MGQWRGKGGERSWERLCQGALKGIEGLEAQGGNTKRIGGCWETFGRSWPRTTDPVQAQQQLRKFGMTR